MVSTTPSKAPKCIICAEGHHFKDCKLDPTAHSYKCANCDGDHPAVNKECPRLKAHTENWTKPKPISEPVLSQTFFSENFPPNQTLSNQILTNNFSAAVNNQGGNFYGVNDPITGMLIFITELVKDLHSETSAIEENDTQTYLDLIERHLGSFQRQPINNFFNKLLIQFSKALSTATNIYTIIKPSRRFLGDPKRYKWAHKSQV